MAIKKTYKKLNRRSKKLRKNFSRFSNIKKALFFAVIFAIAGLAFLLYSHAYPSPYDEVRQASLVDNPARGLVYKGLKAVKANANHPCKGMFEVEGVKPNGKPLCTHGPDEAPDGVDVTKVTAEQRLDQLNRVSQAETTSAQLQAQNSPPINVNDPVDGAFTNTFSMSRVPCTSGNYRIQLVLITHRDLASDPVSVANTQLQKTARRIESQLEYSALHSAGPDSTNKHFRFVTNSSCEPIVKDIRVHDGISLATTSDVGSYLSSHGYTSSYIKYLIWDYSSDATFCGVGSMSNDSQPDPLKNQNNKTTSYAIIAPGCWSSAAEMHEIMHALGAVQNDSPHASGGNHCLDEHDEMCYNDHKGDCRAADGTTFQCGVNGRPLYIDIHCTDPDFRWQLDCGKNDYFNTRSVSTANYLYNHWNVANSPYLQ